MVSDLSGWYSIADLAEMLGVSENALHMYRKHHGINGRRIGRNVLLRLEDLEDYKVSLGNALRLVKGGMLPQ